jgi:hypothetical protein
MKSRSCQRPSTLISGLRMRSGASCKAASGRPFRQSGDVAAFDANLQAALGLTQWAGAQMPAGGSHCPQHGGTTLDVKLFERGAAQLAHALEHGVA